LSHQLAHVEKSDVLADSGTWGAWCTALHMKSSRQNILCGKTTCCDVHSSLNNPVVNAMLYTSV